VTSALLFALSVLSSATAFADIVEALNRVRAGGCDGHPGLSTSLRSTSEMNEIAREWSRGGALRDAIERTKHRIENAASMHVQGGHSEEAIIASIVDSSCSSIVDPAFTHIGVHRAGDQVWVVLGRPFVPPDPGDVASVNARALELVNAARAQPRKCGNRRFPAAPPLRLSPLLERAALTHAQDMMRHGRLEHIGSDGSQPPDRATRVGYRWRVVGENIATGAPDVDTVVADWLASPGHCENIMNPRFKEMGTAYVADGESARIYWAQVFGNPR
jgi:uncharacterized protein YkwD